MRYEYWRNSEGRVKFHCPGCGVWGWIDDDQFNGRVSIWCECPFHETVNLSENGIAMQYIRVDCSGFGNRGIFVEAGVTQADAVVKELRTALGIQGGRVHLWRNGGALLPGEKICVEPGDEFSLCVIGGAV